MSDLKCPFPVLVSEQKMQFLDSTLSATKTKVYDPISLESLFNINWERYFVLWFRMTESGSGY